MQDEFKTKRQEQHDERKKREAEEAKIIGEAWSEGTARFLAEHGVLEVKPKTDSETLQKYRAVGGAMAAAAETLADDPEIQELIKAQETRAKQTILERIQADGKAQPLTETQARDNLTKKAWKALCAKCTDPKNTNYRNWGGNGVRIHEAWEFSYDAFVADVGLSPSFNFELRRVDPAANPHFEPGNVVWVEQYGWDGQGKHPGGRPPKNQQARVEWKDPQGVSHLVTLPELSQLTGIKLVTIRSRYSAGMRGPQLTLPIRHNARGENYSLNINASDGTPMTISLKSICQAKGIPYATVKARIRNGTPIELAFGPRKPAQSIEERRSKQRAAYHAKKARKENSND